MLLLLLEIDLGLTLVMSLVVGVFWWGIQSFLQSHLYICGPHEVLVLSGRTNTNERGEVLGYRIVKGGRTTRVPFLETCQRVSLVPLSVQRKQSFLLADGQKVTLALEAEVKISPAEPALNRAIERFLGVGTDEVAEVAGNTLENALSEFLAGCDSKSLPLGQNLPAELRDPLEANLLQVGLELKSLQLSEA